MSADQPDRAPTGYGTGPGSGSSPGAAAGPAAEPRPAMRDALVEAAVALFAEHGFDATTIDDIVARAGVGRRSFFRSFPSKESVVFPDHEGTLSRMSAFLADESGFAQDPVARVCDAARMVLAMYAADPAFSLARYKLTRQVPALRTHELAVVRRYESALAAFLRTRYAGRADGGLRADVVSAAVVAAHNHALRGWLRSGGHTSGLSSVAGRRPSSVLSQKSVHKVGRPCQGSDLRPPSRRTAWDLDSADPDMPAWPFPTPAPPCSFHAGRSVG